jgi:Arc/MetJ-type ribon-helix-helix transcriptional regulator
MPEEEPYMTIHLPTDLESSIQAAVENGRFSSVDDAMAEAARLLLRTITQEQTSTAAKGAAPHDPLLGI